MARLRQVIAKQTGFAVAMQAGQKLRLTTLDGPQTCDLNIFALPELRERFSAGRTRTRSGIHPSVGDSLWSHPPYDARLMTIIADTVGENDVLFPRCSRSRYEEVGLFNHANCHDNLAAAIAPHGLRPEDVHDTFNAFMRTAVGPDGRLLILPPSARSGDYLEAVAEVDCLIAASACPDGDKHGRVNRPILLEVIDGE
ncbi:hypothetical protein BH23CHL7_BH23CHL7_01960 [soil metagenome]